MKSSDGGGGYESTSQRQSSFSKSTPFNRKPSMSSSQGTTNKKKIDCSQASVLDFVYMCFMFVFKRFVFAPTFIKIGIYVSALIVCSLIRDFRILGTSTNYFAQKHNVFNQYFVKLGWAWTLAALVPFVSMTSLVYTSFNVKHMKNHLSRIVIATIAWYVMTSMFDLIDTVTGHCAVQTIVSKRECKLNKHEWLGFDISGHTFILIYSLLVMVEEVRIFNEWDTFHRKLLEKITNSTASDNEFSRAEFLYQKFTPYIKINFAFMAALALLWEIMLLSTFLFFHIMIHKLLAAFCAIVCWFLTYRTWYMNNSAPWTPGLPGQGSI